MVLPTMVAISRDVLAVVPNEQVEGAMALGATRWQVLRKVVIPGARTGLFGAFTLATGRALGETVAVALVIGNSPFIAHSLKSPAATLPSLIVNNFGEATGTEVSVMFAAGLVLLLIGVAVNTLARSLVRSTHAGAASLRWRWHDHPHLRRAGRPDPRASPPDPVRGGRSARSAQAVLEDRPGSLLGVLGPGGGAASGRSGLRGGQGAPGLERGLLHQADLPRGHPRRGRLERHRRHHGDRGDCHGRLGAHRLGVRALPGRVRRPDRRRPSASPPM